jgi:hypothetical protein
MFEGAENFDQNLGNWDTSGVFHMTDIFHNSGMSAENLSLTLQGWAATAHKKGVHRNIDLGTLPPTAAHIDKKGVKALQYLHDKHGWEYRASQLDNR